MLEPKYLLIVKVSKGLNILDTPRSQSQGARVRRAVPVGTPLDAYKIINIDGVDYAWLVPQNPLKREYVRVAEADHSIEYVDVIPLEDDSSSDLVRAIQALTVAINNIKVR